MKGKAVKVFKLTEKGKQAKALVDAALAKALVDAAHTEKAATPNAKATLDIFRPWIPRSPLERVEVYGHMNEGEDGYTVQEIRAKEHHFKDWFEAVEFAFSLVEQMRGEKVERPEWFLNDKKADEADRRRIASLARGGK